MNTRKTIDGKAAGMMLVICMIWGLQQVVIKSAAPDMSPILQIAIRSGLAALLVTLFIYLRGERIALTDKAWKPGLLAGLLFAMEYLFVGQGLRYTSASHTVVFLYTAPIFAAIGLHLFMPSERLKPVQWAGVGLAFLGIVLAFNGGEVQPASVAAGPVSGVAVSVTSLKMGKMGKLAELAGENNILLGDFLVMLGGMCWGITTIVIRCSRLAVIPASQTLLYQLIGAFVLLIPATILLDQTEFSMTTAVWRSLVFQVVVVSFASFLVWFWLLRNYLASWLGILSFMTPLFGVLFGVLLLNEPLQTKFVIGAILVIAGLILVSGYGWLKGLKNKAEAS